MVKFLIFLIFLRPTWASDLDCLRTSEIIDATTNILKNVEIKGRRRIDMRNKRLGIFDNSYRIDFGDHEVLKQIAELDLTSDLVSARDGITPPVRLKLANSKDEIIFLGLESKGTAIVEINGHHYAMEVDAPPSQTQVTAYRSIPKEMPNQRFFAHVATDGSTIYYIDRPYTLSLFWIEEKLKLKEKLDKNELSFLYQTDPKLPKMTIDELQRAKIIIAVRNKKNDLELALGLKSSEISLTRSEALKGGIKYHHGNLFLDDLTSAEGLILPEQIGGALSLGSLTSAEGLILPEQIGGTLFLDSLTSAKGLILPEQIGGRLSLRKLTSAKGLKLPEIMKDHIFLDSLTSAKGLKLPEQIEGDLYLNSLTSAKGLKLPEQIKGSLYLNSLTSAKVLKLPEKIWGNLELNRLTSAKGLKLPKIINGHLILNSLTSAEGLKLPKIIKGHLYLNRLTSAKLLEFPEYLEGILYLDGLTSAKGLKLPEHFEGSIYLNSLTSTEGLILPKQIGGTLSLDSLTSAKGLKLPEEIGRGLYLNDLNSLDGLVIPLTIPRENIFLPSHLKLPL